MLICFFLLQSYFSVFCKQVHCKKNISSISKFWFALSVCPSVCGYNTNDRIRWIEGVSRIISWVLSRTSRPQNELWTSVKDMVRDNEGSKLHEPESYPFLWLKIVLSENRLTVLENLSTTVSITIKQLMEGKPAMKSVERWDQGCDRRGCNNHKGGQQEDLADYIGDKLILSSLHPWGENVSRAGTRPPVRP